MSLHWVFIIVATMGTSCFYFVPLPVLVFDAVEVYLIRTLLHILRLQKLKHFCCRSDILWHCPL